MLVTDLLLHRLTHGIETMAYPDGPAPPLPDRHGGALPFVGHPEVTNGAESTVPVDLFIPGCPPHPITILDGLLRLLDRLGERRAAGV